MGNIRVTFHSEEVQSLLTQLDNLGRLDEVSSMALNRGANVLLPHIVAAAPVRTGQLKAAIKVGKRKKGSIEVGVFGNDAPYTNLVERGHGGPKPAPAHPFMEPTAEAHEDEVMSAIMQALLGGLN